MNRFDQFAELEQRWSPPRELQYSTPRAFRLSGGGIALTAVGVLLFLGAIAAGVFLSLESMRQTRNYRRLAEEGRETEATVARLWRSAEKNRTAHVEYWFTVAGRRYRNATRVPAAIWKTLQTGERLPVRFLPSNPEINHPSRWHPRVLSLWVAGLAAAFLAILTAAIALAFRRQIDLLSEGRPAPGVVTQVRKMQDSHSGHQTIVYYQFRLLSGAIRKGKRASAGKQVKTGDTLCILYDPHDPRRNSVYPLSLVRAKLP